MRNYFLSLLALILIPAYMSGQVIKGKLQDEKGLPIPGANIVSTETKVSALSDFDGNFTIKANEKETLEFSFIGYETITKKATSNMKVVLKESETALKEVVVIGYGKQKKADVTGSIVSVSGKDIADKPNANAVSALQGKVAGVNIVNSGKPGQAPQFTIRGGGSLNGNVLYVVDGVLTDDISFLNSSDIESFNILKDASSSAIYGIRASNGVVVITTKTGKKGDDKISVSYEGYSGLQHITNLPKMADSKQYIDLINAQSLYNNLSDPSKAKVYTLDQFNNTNTNWYKEVLRTVAPIQSHNLSFLGGSKNTQYSFGLGYLGQEGMVNAGDGVNSGNNYKRLTGRMNITTNISEKMKVGLNTVYTPSTSNDVRDIIYQAYIAPPVLAPYNSDGSYQYLSSLGGSNPKAFIDNERFKSKTNRILADVFAEYEIIKGLDFRTHYSNDYNDYKSYKYIPVYFVSGKQKNDKSSLENTYDNFNNWLWENTLTWKKTFGNHDITLLGGYSKSENYNHQYTTKAENIYFNGNDNVLYQGLSNPKNLDLSSENAERRRFESVFARAQYSYGERYLLNATIRQDKADQFKNNNAAIFPSIGAGWIVSKEDFLQKQNIINFLKLKASWGKLGNGSVPRVADQGTTKDLGNFIGDGTSGGSISIKNTVPDELKWETTTETDLGIEIKLLDNRLAFDATYYNKDITDMVIQESIPTQQGLGDKKWGNFLDANIKGFEFQINWNDKINDDFSYSLYGNLTTIKNEATRVGGDGLNSFLYTGDGFDGNQIIRYEQGVELGSYYGKKYLGVDKNTGNAMFTEDNYFLGSPTPKVTYGFGVNLKYKNLDLGIEFQGVSGNYIYNLNRQLKFDGIENFDADYANNYWTPQNINAKYPNPGANGFTNRKISSLFVEKGDYFRVRNIQFGYNFTTQILNQLKINSIRLYINAQNPINIFNYTGFNPEVFRGRTKEDLNNGTSNVGIDRDVLPISAIYSFGARINF
jgi:TonB-linked SusC/RagA family outer membrane protein